MEALHHQFPLDALADALQVSPSGFEAHRKKHLRPRAQQDEQLRPMIAESFLQSHANYGSPRIQRDLRALGQRCGKNRISRLMREQGLRPKQKRRFRPVTTESSERLPPAENWLAKIPAPDQPGQIWQSDITFIETAEGLALPRLYSRCLFPPLSGLPFWRRSLRRPGPDHLTPCCPRRAPARRPHPSQRSRHPVRLRRLQRDLASWSITPSMSRKGNPYDNALAESFVATIKTECFGGLIPPSKAVARLMLFHYIDGFYNSRRRHSALDYRSPLQFEQEMFPPNRNHQLN
jgi:transposase InsO family protein